MALLSPEEAKSIEAAIAAVEERTAGEIVVAAVRRSDTYAGYRALVAALLTVGVALALFTYGPWWLASPLTFVWQLPLGLAAYALLGTGALLRLLVPLDKREEAVAARAMQLFAERGVHRTRDHSGLLILLSELEHRVVIVGDEGIHQRVGTDSWDRHVLHIVTAIKRERTAEGLLEVISELGDILAHDFPRRADDTNELPDTVHLE